MPGAGEPPIAKEKPAVFRDSGGSRTHREALLVFGGAALVVAAASILFQLRVADAVDDLAGTAFTILIGVIVLAAGSLHLHLVSRRIRPLLDGMEEVRQGQYPLLLVQDQDEISELVVGFNQMVEELRARHERLTSFVSTKETELIHLSQSLDTEREKLETLLENVGEGVVVLDMDGRVIMANQQVSEMFGLPTSAMTHASMDSLIEQVQHRLVNRPKVESQIREMQSSGQGVNEMVLELDGPGGPAIRLYTTPVRGADGTILGRIATIIDLGKEREVERLKTEFLSTISHELRTPLTSIKGALGLIRGGAIGPVSGDMNELLEVAASNVERLITVVNNILDVLSLERGQAGLRFRPMSLPDCARRARDGVSAQAARSDVGVEIFFPDELPPVRGDAKRLEQVFVNLLSNAVKFSPPGQRVLVSGSLEDDTVRVSVRDFGKGIAKEALDRLFEKFEHSEEAFTRGTQGAALGLAICRHIVQAHGGRIWVESVEGEGSTFSFTLPVDERALDPLLRPGRGNSRSVLVVDDDEDVVRIISMVFQAEGYRVLSAYTGEDALALARTQLPDVLTLDLRMPRIDGYQIMDALRRDPRTADIPIVCISVERDPERALAGGASFYLSKPVDIDRLREIAASVGERKGGLA